MSTTVPESLCCSSSWGKLGLPARRHEAVRHMGLPPAGKLCGRMRTQIASRGGRINAVWTTYHNMCLFPAGTNRWQIVRRQDSSIADRSANLALVSATVKGFRLYTLTRTGRITGSPLITQC